jgi:hypothetical protein
MLRRSRNPTQERTELKDRVKGRMSKLALVVALVAVLGGTFAVVASANNLDRQTATNAAKQVAKRDCRNTSGCEDFFVRGLHRVSRHKAVGKIHVISVKNGVRYDCTRQLVIKLDHFSGQINYGVSKRRCENLGPA